MLFEIFEILTDTIIGRQYFVSVRLWEVQKGITTLCSVILFPTKTAECRSVGNGFLMGDKLCHLNEIAGRLCFTI